MFSLDLNPVKELHDDASFYAGIITLGVYSEDFLAAAWLWDADRYRQQWRAAATTVAGPTGRSAFVTSFIHPDADHNVIWPAWRVGDVVFIQNQLLLRELIVGVLDVDHIDRFIADRRTTTLEGHPISEWVVPLTDVISFGDTVSL